MSTGIWKLKVVPPTLDRSEQNEPNATETLSQDSITGEAQGTDLVVVDEATTPSTGQPVNDTDIGSPGSPQLLEQEESENGDASLGYDPNEAENHQYNLRSRDNLRRPSRYCNTCRADPGISSTWTRIRDKRKGWLKRGRQLLALASRSIVNV
jgi:hypothetical protein